MIIKYPQLVRFSKVVEMHKKTGCSSALKTMLLRDVSHAVIAILPAQYVRHAKPLVKSLLQKPSSNKVLCSRLTPAPTEARLAVKKSRPDHVLASGKARSARVKKLPLLFRNNTRVALAISQGNDISPLSDARLCFKNTGRKPVAPPCQVPIRPL